MNPLDHYTGLVEELEREQSSRTLHLSVRDAVNLTAILDSRIDFCRDQINKNKILGIATDWWDNELLIARTFQARIR